MEEYELIIDTSLKNSYSKKIFYKKVTKDYLSKAFVTIINHESIKNNIARQIFTKYGPVAFLPISKNRTSIVFSIKNKENRNGIEIKNLINKYNNFYKIKSFKKIENFELKFSLMRKYYFKNILAFGDALHHTSFSWPRFQYESKRYTKFINVNKTEFRNRFTIK